MNLGQLISIARAGGEFRDCSPRDPSAPEKSVRTVLRFGAKDPDEKPVSHVRTGMTDRIRTLLCAASEPLTLDRIADSLGEIEIEQHARLRSCLHELVKRAHATRTGPRGAGVYVITPLGRKVADGR
jgi:hypothetical protein